MIKTTSMWLKAAAMACLCLAGSPQAFAADQVLSCAPQAADGPELRVLISESMFSKGVILWPSEAGTAIFDITEKTSVSYSAAQRAKPETANPGGRVYINRLNGQLQFQARVAPELARTLTKLCKGSISKQECADTLNGSSIGAAVCFATLDCSKLEQDYVSGIEASYNCKRSSKKF